MNQSSACPRSDNPPDVSAPQSTAHAGPKNVNGRVGRTSSEIQRPNKGRAVNDSSIGGYHTTKRNDCKTLFMWFDLSRYID